MAAKELVVDFTNVKDGGGAFNKKHQPAGDYKAKVLKVEDSPSKKDNISQWLFTIQVGPGTYPYYCKHQENQFWKVRNLLIAAGITVPKKRVKVNPNIVVGKSIAVTLEDDEYEGKMQSNIAATFPLSELSGAGDDEDDAEPEDEGDEDEDDAPIKPVATKKKAAVVEDDDDEDDEPAPPKKAKKAKPVVEDDDDDDEDDEPAPVKKKKPVVVDDDDDDDDEPAPVKKKAKKVEVDDDELEELDIDDV